MEATESAHAKLLLIEDDAASRSLLTRMIARFEAPSFEVTAAESLTAALPEIMSGDASLILVDLGLPESTGIPTIDRVRALAKDTPIIACTGSAGLGVACIEAGATDYLHKDHLTPTTVRRSLVFALERHHRRLAEQLRASIARDGALVDRQSWGPAPAQDEVALGVGTPGVRGILDEAYGGLLDVYASWVAGATRVPRASLDAVAATFGAVRASSTDLTECHTRTMRRLRDTRSEVEISDYVAAGRELGLDLLARLAEHYRVSAGGT